MDTAPLSLSPWREGRSDSAVAVVELLGAAPQVDGASDGTRANIGDKGLGEATPYQISVSGRLRIRLNFLMVTGTGYGTPAYGAPQALCLASPF